MTIGELVYKITGDSKGLQSEVKKSDSKVKGLGATFGKFAKLGVAAIAAVGVAMATKITKELVNAASMAEETQNKFNVVFRGIEEDADSAAKNLQDNFGLSGVAAQRMLSDTGDLLVGLGLTSDAALDLADQAAQLGTDLASFTNFAGGAEGATDALRKAMLGETESAKALGLVLGETQLKEYADRHGLVISQLTLAEKAQIRLKMAMEQSVNAIGDFDRSSNSFANQSRIASAAVDDFKAALGEGLLPIATEVVSKFADIVKGVTNFVTRTLQAWDAQRKLNRAMKGEAEDLETAQAAYDKVNSELQDFRKQLEEAEKPLSRQAQSIPQVVQANRQLQETLKASIETREGQLIAISQTMRRLEGEQVIQAASIEITDAQTESTNNLKDAEAELEEQRVAEEEAAAQRFQNRIDRLQDEATNEQNLRNAEIALDALVKKSKEDLAASEIKLEQAKQAARQSAFDGFLALTALGAQESIELFNLNKGLASADALINSYLAFTKTLADGGPFPFNTINAAGVLAAGLAQQIKILGQKPPQFASGGIVPSAPGVPTTGDRMLAAVNPGEVILNEAQQRNLANKMQGGGMGNITLTIMPREIRKWFQAEIDNQEIIIR